MAADATVTIAEPSHVDNAAPIETANVVASEEGSEGVTQVVVPAEGNPKEVSPGAEEGTQETPKAGLETPKVGEKATATPEQKVEAAVADGSIDMDALAQEYAKEGGLTEKTYQDLAAKGFTKDIVDTYIDGRKAQVAAYNQSLTEAVGGNEALGQVLSWAAGALSDGEKVAANKALQSMDLEQARLVLGGLKARYESAVGREPKLVQAPSAPAKAGPQPYESNAQMVADMQNPKYRTDPAFRRMVEARLAAG